MVITEEAKVLLKNAIDESESNCIQVTIQRSCCGEGLMFELIKDDLKRAKMIDDIPFIMDFEASMMCHSKRIEVQNG